MMFYRVSSIEIGASRYAWSSGYGPIKKMPFFDNFGEEEKESFRCFWGVCKSIPGILVDSGGKEWGDVLGCGGGPPSQFFSERIIDCLRDEGVKFLRDTEMPIAEIASKRLGGVVPPRYFVLEAEAGLEIRSESVSIAEQIATRKEKPPRWAQPYRTKGVLSTWNGADLFSPLHGKSLTSLFCTERIKILAERERWTNIKFDAIDVV